MTPDPLDAQPRSLASLGWSAFFADQVEPAEADFAPCRISAVHRSRLGAMAQARDIELTLPAHTTTRDFAVGDWVLVDPTTLVLRRRLDRRTLLQRTGGQHPQLAGANVDTMFIVTSCNADFNLARLERYLALANEAGTTPVILLTKPDTTDDPGEYERQGASLQRGLAVVTLNPRTPEAAAALAPWCGVGETVALIGSSGVGKSTLVNTLVGPGHHIQQDTGSIREHDGKGRHTTTSRSLHPIAGGGWVIDTPGMRSIQINDMAGGIDTLFAEITELAPLCRFRDCSHEHEPGCAVQDAVTRGTLMPERLDRWRKLSAENRGNAAPERGGPKRNPSGR